MKFKRDFFWFPIINMVYAWWRSLCNLLIIMKVGCTLQSASQSTFSIWFRIAMGTTCSKRCSSSGKMLILARSLRSSLTMSRHYPSNASLLISSKSLWAKLTRKLRLKSSENWLTKTNYCKFFFLPMEITWSKNVSNLQKQKNLN